MTPPRPAPGPLRAELGALGWVGPPTGTYQAPWQPTCPSLGILEKPLEKKSGRSFGPPGTKKLIYFIDDMNTPEVDKYGTVAPHTLIRQHMDHRHWQAGSGEVQGRGARARGDTRVPSLIPWARMP